MTAKTMSKPHQTQLRSILDTYDPLLLRQFISDHYTMRATELTSQAATLTIIAAGSTPVQPQQ